MTLGEENLIMNPDRNYIADILSFKEALNQTHPDSIPNIINSSSFWLVNKQHIPVVEQFCIEQFHFKHFTMIFE